jgi:hypothetical protein
LVLICIFSIKIISYFIFYSQKVHISCEFINFFGAIILVCGALFAMLNLLIIFLNSFLGTQLRMVLINKQGISSELSSGKASMELLIILYYAVLFSSDIGLTITARL